MNSLSPGDRKSTRLNSSHDQISYAVFCLKKKKYNVRGSFTYYFEGSQGTPNFGFDSTSLGWPSNVVSQFPAAQVGGLFPVFTFDEFVQLGRGFGPNENKIYTIQ